MIIESRETTIHQLAIDKEYKSMYPDVSSDNRYISQYWRKFNKTARVKEKRNQNGCAITI